MIGERWKDVCDVEKGLNWVLSVGYGEGSGYGA
jgi:hypothetical protein